MIKALNFPLNVTVLLIDKIVILQLIQKFSNNLK